MREESGNGDCDARTVDHAGEENEEDELNGVVSGEAATWTSAVASGGVFGESVDVLFWMNFAILALILNLSHPMPPSLYLLLVWKANAVFWLTFLVQEQYGQADEEEP